MKKFAAGLAGGILFVSMLVFLAFLGGKKRNSRRQEEEA
jgi:hypothetical protein